MTRPAKDETGSDPTSPAPHGASRNAEPQDSGLPLEPVEVPLDGELDLHTFRPQDAGSVVEAYLEECRRRGIRRVRIVHGKGIGALRRTVEAVLRRHSAVAGFRLCPSGLGGWGATLVDLRSPGDTS